MTVRRMSDIILALVLLFVCFPVLLLSCFAVWIALSASPLARVERVTREGRIVTVYKLRTTIDTAYGPRVTEFGAFLRHTYLDQIPLLLNVLIGDLPLLDDKAVVGGALGSKNLLAVREP
jgi:lipopolysaccharide/colanic/teichoic acid biosynthesis glycosyltransferase